MIDPNEQWMATEEARLFHDDFYDNTPPPTEPEASDQPVLPEQGARLDSRPKD